MGLLLAVHPFANNIYFQYVIIILYFAIAPFIVSVISNLLSVKFFKPNNSVNDKKGKPIKITPKFKFIPASVKKLLKGEIKLWITFWLFGILVIAFLNYFRNFLLNHVDQFNNITIYVLDIFSLIYIVLIYIAIWNSADKYKGNQILAASAKLIVILSILQTLFNYNTGLLTSSTKNTEHRLSQEIELINKRLPIKIDDHTILFKIKSDNNKLFYYYKIVNLNQTQTENLKNYSAVRKSIELSACRDKNLKFLLNENIVIIYKYYLGDNELMSISIDEKYCNQIN